MIITVFAILIGVSLVLMILGFSMDIVIFSIAGATLLMVIGAVVVADEGIEYKQGEDITTIDNGDNTTTTYVTDVYGTPEGEGTIPYWWILLVLGVAAVAYSLFTIGD